jgi:mannose-6-phosphate isomerase-like protein (cupin superfamily)
MRRSSLFLVSVVLAAGSTQAQSPVIHQRSPGGYIMQNESDIAKTEPGTHNGGGQTIGYSFFDKTPGLALVFRKRALKPGSGIGYHEQKEDEIYYVLSGHGAMTVDGKTFDVGPGTAVLTRPGSSHGIKQQGMEDLVMMINYEQPAK